MLGISAAYAFCNLVLIHNWATAFEMVVGLALMKYFQSVHPRSNNLACIHRQIFQHHNGIAVERHECPKRPTQTHIHRIILHHSLPHPQNDPTIPPTIPQPSTSSPSPPQPPRHLQNLLPKRRMPPPLPRIRRFSHRIQDPRHLIADQAL